MRKFDNKQLKGFEALWSKILPPDIKTFVYFFFAHPLIKNHYKTPWLQFFLQKKGIFSHISFEYHEILISEAVRLLDSLVDYRKKTQTKRKSVNETQQSADIHGEKLQLLRWILEKKFGGLQLHIFVEATPWAKATKNEKKPPGEKGGIFRK